MQNTIYERRLRRVITSGLLLAITLLLTMTPVGLIPVPTPAGSATIAHIPAIIAGILEGPLAGLIVSFGFGFGTLITPLPMVTRDPLVLVLPRMFIGVVAYYVWAGLRRADRRSLTIIMVALLALVLAAAYEVSKSYLWLGSAIAVAAVAGAVVGQIWLRRQETITVSLAAAAVAGSLTNTVLVLAMAVVRQVTGITPGVAVTVGITQGIPEAIVAAIVVVAVISALRQYNRRRKSNL